MSKTPKLRQTPRKRRQEAADALHDSLCQTLTGVHLFSSVLTRRAKKKDRSLGKEMAELNSLIDQARTECHVVLAMLRGTARKKSVRKRPRQAGSSR